jgi:hypothetical protein
MGLLQELNLPPPRAKPARAKPKASASSKPKKAAAQYNVNNFGALVVAIEHEYENRSHPKAKVSVGAFDASDLIGEHRTLLLGLHAGVVLVKPDPAKALQLWERVAPALRSAVSGATASGVAPDAVGATLGYLDQLDKELFVPAAYYAAEREASASSTLETPDTAQFAAKLRRAENELMSADELFGTTVSVASGIANLGGFQKPGQVKDIIELVMLKGSIEDKLKEARKRGIATTTAELVSKVTGATGVLIKTVGGVGKAAAEAQRAILLARATSKATTQAAEELSKLAGKFEKLAKLGESLGKAASAAAIIAGGVRLVGALRDGKFSEAGAALLDMAVDAAPLVIGEAGGVALTGIIFLVKTELAAIHMAAEFIRWCRDETVRQAALSFIEQCVRLTPTARTFVAACDVMLQETNPGVQAIAERRATAKAKVVYDGMRALQSHVFATTRDAIGGHPALVKALGPEARSALELPFSAEDGALMVAQQIASVFKGANTMALFVKATYKN